MKSYQSIKKTGVAWVGAIPVHWKLYRFKFVYQASNAGEVIDKSHWNQGEELLFTCQRTPMRSSYPTFDNNRRTRRNDLLLTRNGTPYVHLPPENAIYSNVVQRVGLSNSTDRRFVWYALSNSALNLKGYGDIIESFNMSTWNNLVVSIPPLEEQKAIVRYLDKKLEQIDTFIQNKRRLIELLEEQKTAIINKAVTQGLDLSVTMKDSGIDWLGEIPANWTSKRIKFMTEILRGKFSHRPRNDPAFYDGEHPFVQTGDVARAGKFLTAYSQTLNEKGLSVSKMFPKGTLVMTIAANVGDISILDFEACFPDSIVGFIPKADVHLFFLYYLFIAMKQELLRTAPINTQLNLNVDRIGTLFAPLPPIPVQKQIVKHLDLELKNFLEAQEIAQQEINLINEYRTTLISEVVTGKIDVRGLV